MARLISLRMNSALLLTLSIGCAGLFTYIIMNPIQGQNFSTEAWEAERFVELWWLWTLLPGCVACAILAGNRSKGICRITAYTMAIVGTALAVFTGFSFWKQW